MKKGKLNSSGFVLVETLIVTVVVLTIFSVLYSSFSPIIGEYGKRDFYDDIDGKYGAYWIKKIIEHKDVSIKTTSVSKLNGIVKSGGSILDCGGRGYLMFKCGSDSDNDFVVDSSIWTVCEEFYTKLSVSNIYVTKYNLSDFKQKLIYGCDEPGTSGDISLGDFSGGMHRYVSYLPEYNVDSLNGAKYRVIVEFERADGDGVKYMAYSTFEVIK